MEKMENIIEKSIGSKAVQLFAKSERMKEVEVWSLFFDSGLDYLSQLRHRISRHDVFKAQFGGIALRSTPTEAFKSIMASPFFWNWWSTQLWRVCNSYADESENEIYIRLMFSSSLIPQSTLEKIFVNETRQKISIKQEGMPRGFKHRTEQVC